MSIPISRLLPLIEAGESIFATWTRENQTIIRWLTSHESDIPPEIFNQLLLHLSTPELLVQDARFAIMRERIFYDSTHKRYARERARYHRKRGATSPQADLDPLDAILGLASPSPDE